MLRTRPGHDGVPEQPTAHQLPQPQRCSRATNPRSRRPNRRLQQRRR